VGASYRRHNRAVGRGGRIGVVMLCALALASAAQAKPKPLLGVYGNEAHFEVLTGQKSTVRLAFLGWGQGLSFGSPFVTLFKTLGPIPMIHLNTGSRTKEAITPAQLAAGKGDGYLIALNRAISEYGGGIYVRPMAEMNNSTNVWSGFTRGGAAKPGHSTADYRKAFSRIYLILHGGSAATITRKLKALGMSGIAQDLASNPFPRLRIVWNPLAGGSPRIAANSAQSYYPGRAYVDVEGVDIYDESTGAPWQGVEDAYKAALLRQKPFTIPEFGLIRVDDPAFVTQACAFLNTHKVEAAGFYEGSPGGPFDLATKPKSKSVYTTCVPLLGAPVPAWATAKPGTTPVASGPSVAFTLQGAAVGSPIQAPIGADELEVNIAPATGVIGSAFWIRGGKALAKMTIPDGVTGLLFQTKVGGTASDPIIRPHAGTDFHVRWNGAGAITSAWTRVGKLLAQIPVTSGQTSIAMSQG
jgi:hypothetical protein